MENQANTYSVKQEVVDIPVEESSNQATKKTLLNDNVRKTHSCFMNTLFKVIPLTKWLSNYSLESFKFDLTAGVTVGVMVIPQSMAYAMLAGLPPIYGLYCCLIPLFIYGLLGTCGQVAIGPCAIVSIMCGSALSFLNASADVNDYVLAMMTLSAISGIFLIILGVFRLGIVTSLLSETVVTSFTASSAFNIAASQLKHFWGVSTNKDSFLEVLLDIFRPEKIRQFNWYAFLMGVSAMILLFILKKINSKFLPKQPLPMELLLIIIYISLMWGFDLHNKWHLKYLGDYALPKGFAPFTIPSMKYLDKLIPQGIAIGTVAYVITISMGKTFSRKNGYHVDDNQELIALGGASLGGSFFSAYPCTGSLSRSSLINNIGSRTPVNTLIAPMIVLICLYFLVDAIKFIPNACLAAIVIVNLISLFKRFGELGILWKGSRGDFWTFLLGALSTGSLGTTGGLLSTLGVSYVALIVGMLEKKMEMKKQPLIMVNMEAVCDISNMTNVVICGKYIHFLNRGNIMNKVDKVIDTNPAGRCILDLRNVIYVDASALISIEEIYKQFSIDNKIVLLVETNYLQDKLIANNMADVHTSRNVD